MSKPNREEVKRKELTRNDGPDERSWCGPWFKPVVGVAYKIPENAANYTSKRGWIGTCVDTMESSFGHTWAILKFHTPKRVDKPMPVRTTYLVREDGGEVEQVDVPPGVFNTISMMERAWQGPSNSGTERITQS